MKTLVKFVLISTLLVGVYGCSAESASEKADADARLKGTAAPGKTAVKPAKAKLVIPAGTKLSVALIDSLDTDKNSAGDHFLASMAEPILVDGKTLVEKGTKVRGRVVEVQNSGRVKGRASISLVLAEIVYSNRTVAITTATFAATADSTQKRDAGIIAGGAGVGAAIGAIAGGKKGAGIGAVAGGGAGTGAVLGTKGKQIHYGPETRLSFTLTQSVEM
jgi:hypothetical protein